MARRGDFANALGPMGVSRNSPVAAGARHYFRQERTYTGSRFGILVPERHRIEFCERAKVRGLLEDSRGADSPQRKTCFVDRYSSMILRSKSSFQPLIGAE